MQYSGDYDLEEPEYVYFQSQHIYDNNNISVNKNTLKINGVVVTRKTIRMYCTKPCLIRMPQRAEVYQGIINLIIALYYSDKDRKVDYCGEFFKVVTIVQGRCYYSNVEFKMTKMYVRDILHKVGLKPSEIDVNMVLNELKKRVYATAVKRGSDV